MNEASIINIMLPAMMRNRKLARKAKMLILFVAALPVGATISVAWVLQLIIFAPLLILAWLAVPVPRTPEELEPRTTGYRPGPLVFDRLRDVSKLLGCNSRNVRYRWATYLESLQQILHKCGAVPPRALDFGAASLRDSYELARLGFRVTALDVDESAMREGLRYYDWSPWGPPQIVASLLEDVIPREVFDVVTAFDVIEHLRNPEHVLALLKAHLRPEGVLLVTVPNRLSVWERVWHWQRKSLRRRGVPDPTSGVPHLQFRTPAEWRQFFEKQGYSVVRHDMTIGFLVNDAWHGLYGVFARTLVEPVILAIAGSLKLPYKPGGFEKLYYPTWLMTIVHRLDLLLKPVLRNRWGWNLFVLRPS